MTKTESPSSKRILIRSFWTFKHPWVGQQLAVRIKERRLARKIEVGLIAQGKNSVKEACCG